jgi:hypothetical protein
MVGASERFGDHAVGAQLDLPDFFDDFAGDHGWANETTEPPQRRTHAGNAGRGMSGIKILMVWRGIIGQRFPN